MSYMVLVTIFGDVSCAVVQLTSFRALRCLSPLLACQSRGVWLKSCLAVVPASSAVVSGNQ